MNKMEELETTKINDIEYVMKAEVEKLLSKVDKKSISPKYILADPCHVIALGSCNITEDYNYVHIDIDLLKKAITIFKQLDVEYITCGFKQDFPLMMGKIEADEKTIHGVLIAPRVDPDDDKE